MMLDKEYDDDDDDDDGTGIMRRKPDGHTSGMHANSCK